MCTLDHIGRQPLSPEPVANLRSWILLGYRKTGRINPNQIKILSRSVPAPTAPLKSSCSTKVPYPWAVLSLVGRGGKTLDSTIRPSSLVRPEDSDVQSERRLRSATLANSMKASYDRLKRLNSRTTHLFPPHPEWNLLLLVKRKPNPARELVEVDKMWIPRGWKVFYKLCWNGLVSTHLW